MASVALANAARRTVARLRGPRTAGWAWCLLLVAAAWPVWLHRLAINDLDEAASSELLFARQPLWTVVTELPWNDQSPLSFAFLHFWLAFGDEPAAVRSLNLLLLTASLLLLHALCRRLCPPPAVALAAVALAVVSPASLWAVRSGRMYSVQLLLWTAGAYFMVRYAEGRRLRDLAGLLAATTLGIYNHFVGFVAAGTVVLWLVVEALAEARLAPAGERAEARRRLLGPPVAAALALFVAVQPQIMRLLAVLREPPAVVPGQAVPGGWVPFLDAVSTFWFLNAGWGALSPHASALRMAYLAGAYLLFVMGLARGSATLRRLLVVTVVVPLVLIGLAAGRLDFRDRHFLYLLPLVWIALANGALGARRIDEWRLPAALARAAVVVFAWVAASSAWLLYQKLPERYYEWTKVFDGLAQLHRPGLALYMEPSPLTGMPELVASRLDRTGGMTLEPLVEDTRLEFLAGAAGRRDFAFLEHPWNHPGAERGWRTQHLQDLGYRQFVLSSGGASARVFVPGDSQSFSIAHTLPGTSTREVVAWARRRAADPSRAPHPESHLGRALVARVRPDGTVDESTHFTSQRGESGTWRLGPGDGDTVDAGRARIGLVERDVIHARAEAGSLLVMHFPETHVGGGLRLTCGVTWSSPAVRHPDVVSVEVFVDGEPSALATCPAAGWHDVAVDTLRARGRTADVTVAMAAMGVDTATVTFRFASPARGAALPSGAPAPPAGPATLLGGRTLKDHVERLRVYRTGKAGFGRLTARFDPSPRSAADLHERAAGDGEGGLGARWQVGEPAWDAVGRTRQRSGGQPRVGLWAHPRRQTTLVIELDGVALGPVLEGFYGFTDFAMDYSERGRLEEPAGFRVLLDGRPLLARQAARKRGWDAFSADVPRAGAGRLRVEVDAAEDHWAHFVFDLWSR